MKLHNYLDPIFIFPDIDGNTKEQVFCNLIEKISKLDSDCSKIEKELINKIIEREKNLTTAMGNGVSLPHVRIKNYDDVLIAIAILKNPIPTLTVEDKEDYIKVVFLIITSDKKSTLMLQLLAGITKLSRDKQLLDKIINGSKEDIIKVIKKANIETNKKILAEDLMNSNVNPATPFDTLESIANRFLYEKCHAFPVVEEDGKFLGEITEKELIKFGMPKITPLISNLTLLQDEDLFEDYFKRGTHVKIKELYRKKVLIVDKKASIMEIAFSMVKNKFSRAYVIEEGKYLGVITRSDIVRKVLNI